MPTFRSPRNPKFKLKSARLPRLIEFTDGAFSTDDLDEIKALRRHVKAGSLLELSIDESHDAYVAGEKTLPEFEADVEDVLRSEGEHSGEFHTGGVVPNTGAGTALIHHGEDILTPEQAQALDGGDAEDPHAGVSRSDLVEYAQDGLGLNIPRGASRKSVLDAIRIAEQEAADGDEDFDPNDPEGS